MFSNLKQSRGWKLSMILFLGFASGLPLALTGQAMQAWLTVEKIDIATIGFLSLVGLPYTFKFLWAPLMDRFEIPFFGRRRGWLVLSQLSIAGVLVLLSTISPSQNTETFALIAALVAFLSASQDIVIDAYRTDTLLPAERGAGASLGVLGYRLAMILSGGITFVWADVNGNNWSWSKIYLIMAAVMAAAAVISLLFLPSVAKNSVAPKTNAKNDFIGFFALVIAVVVGYQLTTKVASPQIEKIFDLTIANNKKWADLISFFVGLGITLPLAWLASQKAKFETLNISLKNYFSMKGAAQFLILIILYKLGDAFAGSLLTPFLIKSIGFTTAEIGVVNKVIGMWLTIGGAILGGAIMIKWGLFRSLLAFGILQMVSNLGFWLLAVSGRGAWGSFSLPAFDFLIVSLKEATQVDWLLLFSIGSENITGGMGTAAFVAFLMALCNQKFSATQYALLSSLSVIGRVFVGPVAGVLTEVIGWSSFFIFSTVAAAPGLIMLYKMKDQIKKLETPDLSNLAED
jgi:MFS transporter, PAT family, beta-lactamase induction signal transducer AmpG